MDDLLEFNVNLYAKPPCGSEHLFQQIEMARERLKLYQIFQTQEILTVDELKMKLDSPLKHLLETTHDDIVSVRRMDVIGHWTLRIAYSPSHPQFFINNELRWFKMRFNSMPQDDRRRFLERNKVELMEATKEEKLKFNLEGLWYKVHFTRAPALVSRRMYPLNAGFIFIPEHEIVFVLLEQIEKHLKEAVIHVKKMLAASCEQLKFIFSMLDLVKPYRYLGAKILPLEDLKKSIRHFPLCMKFQHETLTKNHHLKHFSRFQYGLFLKGIGLPLDDALQMWQDEFTHKMTQTQFIKRYSYFFKHLYGTVGSKIDYEPQNCEKILEENPSGDGAVNGCPYKHWDEVVLAERLRKDGISEGEVEEILVLKRNTQYKEACTRCFECVHHFKPDEIITHPVMFYEKSCSAGVVDIEDMFASDSD